jgi:hypothetical protein
MEKDDTNMAEVHHLEDEKVHDEFRVLQDAGKTNVISLALTTAVVKDKPATWSTSMIKLYGIMLLCTLSKPQTSDFLLQYDGDS